MTETLAILYINYVSCFISYSSCSSAGEGEENLVHSQGSKWDSTLGRGSKGEKRPSPGAHDGTEVYNKSIITDGKEECSDKATFL